MTLPHPARHCRPSGSERPVRRALTLLDSMARRASELSGAILDVDELVSAGHLAITRALASHDPRLAPLAPYLAMRLRWALASEARLQRRRFRERPVAPAGKEPPSPEDEVTAGLRRRALHDAIAQLPAEERRVVDEHYFGGKSLRDIARHNRTSKSTAWRRHRAAVRQLRSQLGGEAATSSVRSWGSGR